MSDYDKRFDDNLIKAAWLALPLNIQGWVCEYLETTKPFAAVYDGIVFWGVGQNASHYFYIGYDPETEVFWRKAIDTTDMSGDSDTVKEFDITEVRNIYWGHY